MRAGDYAQGITPCRKMGGTEISQGGEHFTPVYYYIAYGYDNLPGAEAAGPAEHYAALGEKL